MSDAKPRTLFDKIWDSHVVEKLPDGTCILYIDRHLLHEVTSPQAFEGLRVTGRKLRRPDRTIAVADHNIPTVGSRPQPTSRKTTAAFRSRRWKRMSLSSASRTSQFWMCGRASCTLSVRSLACPSPERRSSAAIA